MKAIVNVKYGSPDVLQLGEMEKPALKIDETAQAYAELERGVHAALET